MTLKVILIAVAMGVAINASAGSLKRYYGWREWQRDFIEAAAILAGALWLVYLFGGAAK